MDIRPIASGSSGNAYWISDGKTPLLLDAGIPMKAIQIGCGFRVRELGGCFITHCHGDHSKAAKDLLRYGVDVYTGQGTAEACRLEGHRLHITRPLEQLTVGTFLVLPFDVEHDAPDSQGFLLESTATGEKLLYFTDTYYLKYRFSGITHILGECNYTRERVQENLAEDTLPTVRAARLMHSHMSLQHLVEFLGASDLSRLKQIYLVHLSAENSDEAEMKRRIQRLTGADVYVC